jgi:hypothetical protein
MRPIGQRVKILGGMPEFVGKCGEIRGNHERDGTTVMYRVRLDEPVMIPGVGEVSDDLWAGSFLKTLRGTTAQGHHEYIPQYYCE